MNFKIGQRVVFLEVGRFTNQIVNRPKHHEICKIIGKPANPNHWILQGYEKSYVILTDMVMDIIWHEESLRPLSERTAESEAFAENLITQLETEVETLEWLHK